MSTAIPFSYSCFELILMYHDRWTCTICGPRNRRDGSFRVSVSGTSQFCPEAWVLGTDDSLSSLLDTILCSGCSF